MIELRRVSVSYGERTVLRDVDLAVAEGELVLVAGRTGVGKSTLLGTFNGLVPTFTGGRLVGDVLVDGVSVVHRPPRERAHVVGYVGQDPSAGFVTDSVTLRERVGDVACELDGNRATFTAAQLPAPFDVATPSQLAEAVGLTVSDLHPEFAPVGLSCGVPFAFVPVRNVDAVSRSRAVAGSLGLQFYVCAPVDDSRAHWRARMFATAFGIAEDPATGSAAAAFAGLVAPLGLTEVMIDQGVEMGRPSRIYVGIGRDDAGRLDAVRVGGDAVVIGGGHLRVP